MTGLSRTDLIIKINAAQLAGFHHYAAALLQLYRIQFPAPSRHETHR